MKTVAHRCLRSIALLTIVLAIATCTLTAQSPGSSREAWQRPDDIVAALGLTPGSRVADIGAGDGFFTVRLARAVGDSGRVLAVDVEPKMLETLKQLAQKEKLPNVDVIHGHPNDPHLEPDSVNAVLIVHAYHEMGEHGAMLTHIRKALRPKGRLVIVEQITEARRDAPRDVQVKAHDLAPEYVVSELHAAGFRVERLDANFTTNPATKDINWIIVATPGTRPAGPSRADVKIRTTVRLTASLGSEQHQATKSPIARSYVRWPLADVRVFRTPDLACSRSRSARTRFGAFSLRAFDLCIGNGLLCRRRELHRTALRAAFSAS